MMENNPISIIKRETDLARTNLATMKWYYALLILTTIVLIVGIGLKLYNEIIISIPVIIMLLGIIRYDKDFIHVPPLLIFFAVVVMYLSLGSSIVSGDNTILTVLSEFMIGVLLGSFGIIIAYVALGKMPGFAKERPGLIAIESFAFGVAVATIWNLIEFHLDSLIDSPFLPTDTPEAMFRLSWIALGSLFISVMFMVDSHYGLMRMTITRFLGENSDIIGIEKDAIEEMEMLIDGGETNKVEFKSTVRTNLETGEKDKRMEKAVLKTLVAFLNSDGGDLFVGVSDDGEKIGADIESFDSPDRMNLHITNLISSQIGDEFIPFIRFRQFNFGTRDDGTDRIVVRFTCEPTSTPVFLRNGKESIFYIRSGPSSVELTGEDLLKYVDNRRKKVKGKYIAAKRPQ